MKKSTQVACCGPLHFLKNVPTFGFLPIAFLLFAQNVFGQIKDSTIEAAFYEKTGRERIFQMNMSPLITQLVPFNRSNPLVTGPYMVRFKKYKNNKAFRFGLGANLHILTEDNSERILNLAMGWERRKRVSGRVAMTAGVDGFLSVGGFNIQGSNSSGNDGLLESDFEGGIGIGPTWGLEYALTRNISISTETALHIPIASTLGLFLVPPTAIYVNYRFFRPTVVGQR